MSAAHSGDGDGGAAASAGATRLRPAPAHALAWTLVGAVGSAAALWLVADTGGHALAVALLIACLVATAPWAAQLLLPGAFSWRLDPDGLVVRRLHRRLTLTWAEVELARVVRVGGDPALELQLAAPAGDTADVGTGAARRPSGATVTLRLPVGADLAALHRALAAHLGRIPGRERAAAATPRPPWERPPAP